MTKMACLWFAFCVIVGGFLFQTTQRVNDGRQRLAVLTADIQEEEESLRVLQAEWSYLNQPDRLEKLSREYLHLSPMKGQQFARTHSIPLRPQPIIPAAETDALLAAATPDDAETLATGTMATAALPRMPVRKPVYRPAVVKISPAPTPVSAPAVVVRTAKPVQKTDAPRTAGDDNRSFTDVMHALGVAGR